MPAVIAKITRRESAEDWFIFDSDESINKYFTPAEIKNLHEPAIKELKELRGFKDLAIKFVNDTDAEIRYNFDSVESVRKAYDYFATPPENSARYKKNQRIVNLVRAKKLFHLMMFITEH